MIANLISIKTILLIVIGEIGWMILSILLVNPKNDKEKTNDDKVTLSAIKMKWNNKQNI